MFIVKISCTYLLMISLLQDRFNFVFHKNNIYFYELIYKW